MTRPRISNGYLQFAGKVKRQRRTTRRRRVKKKSQKKWSIYGTYCSKYPCSDSNIFNRRFDNKNSLKKLSNENKTYNKKK